MDRWLGVEIRHLAALQALDAERSFRGAADRLGYVQSAVSQQLSALERIVGTRLVERTRGHSHVQLTEPGKLLLQHAQRVFDQLTAARADLEALTGSTEGHVRLGGFQSVATQILPTVLARLAVAHPDIDVSTSEAPTDADLFGAVAAGDLDLAFAELPLEPGPFDGIELLIDPCVLLVPAAWPLARSSEPLTLEQIAGLPLAFPNWRRTGPIQDLLRDEGRTLDATVLETNTAVQALVAAGVSAAILPQLAVDLADEDTVVLPLDGLLEPRTLVLYWHRDRVRSAAALRVTDVVVAVCRQVGIARRRLTAAAAAPEQIAACAS